MFEESFGARKTYTYIVRDTGLGQVAVKQSDKRPSLDLPLFIELSFFRAKSNNPYSVTLHTSYGRSIKSIGSISTSTGALIGIFAPRRLREPWSPNTIVLAPAATFPDEVRGVREVRGHVQMQITRDVIEAAQHV